MPRALPPHPSRKPVTPAKPEPPKYKRSEEVKAKDIRIELEDGTTLVATGGHAADLYNWLMDCERVCASRQLVSPYLGPTFRRIDEAGNTVGQPMPERH
jgi:hypothetical protein